MAFCKRCEKWNWKLFYTSPSLNINFNFVFLLLLLSTFISIFHWNHCSELLLWFYSFFFSLSMHIWYEEKKKTLFFLRLTICFATKIPFWLWVYLDKNLIFSFHHFDNSSAFFVFRSSLGCYGLFVHSRQNQRQKQRNEPKNGPLRLHYAPSKEQEKKKHRSNHETVCVLQTEKS